MKFYVTTTEISKGLGVSRYLAAQVFKEIREVAFKTDTPLINRNTVPTKLLCRHLKISSEDFMKNLKEKQ